MDFLKNIFGYKALTYAELEAALEKLRARFELKQKIPPESVCSRAGNLFDLGWISE